ncbi:hypothetical protein EYF80_038468 [Liparis tanakae]|uniref:Uncharacterized protein n=1 Tax=Liparis tanakae TaxID=230148 RepID=A0A4Z2GF11_9TELE|nr:hypothetical protein EYF80_038468 [Liparis tanakae]
MSRQRTGSLCPYSDKKNCRRIVELDQKLRARLKVQDATNTLTVQSSRETASSRWSGENFTHRMSSSSCRGGGLVYLVRGEAQGPQGSFVGVHRLQEAPGGELEDLQLPALSGKQQ